MALVKEALKKAILAAFEAQQEKTENPNEALGDMADKLATAIDAFVKSGTVNLSNGSIV